MSVIKMPNVAYVPPVAYSKQNETIPTKQDFFSYLALNAKRISKYATVIGNSSGVLYTVPEGQTLFLVALHGILIVETVGGANAYCYPNVDPTETFLNLISTSSTTWTAVNDGISFPIPVRIVSGERLVIACNQAQSTASFSMIGYLIDNSLFSTFA